MLNIILLLAAGTSITTTHFVGKKGLQRINTKAYVYSINVVTFFCLLPFFLIFDFNISQPITWHFLIIIGSAALVKLINNFGFINGLNKITPLEMASFAALGIALTYFIDIIIGSAQFNPVSIIFLSMVIIATFYMLIRLEGGVKLKAILIVYVITSMLRGYTTHFSLYYMNEFAFAIIIAIISLLFFLPLTNKFKPSKDSIKTGLIAQGIGMINFIALIYLAGNSTTLYMLAFPVRISITIIFTLLINDDVVERPTFKHVISSFVILLAATGYVLSQIQ
ncbi:MAG: hypothetical protein ACOCP8_09050 [archaeon]